ncbi:MAG: BamA/TamA family outer membrane protein [Thiotrichaceae bacterium]|nr:BamA/TamA family outer membrane protein [Thiotrichaceae bacterium]PCI13161.1 MAG: hypothetical protein COB71_06760 [Thiotrichales bacterium]
MMFFLLRRLCYCLLGLAFISPAVMANAALIIDEIRFVGNEKTLSIVMLQEMQVKAGDPVDLLLIENDRQAIMDLRLFKFVYADVIDIENRQVLQIMVSEKYYIFPLPRLNRSADGDISYGVRLKMDNLGGLNQRLRLTYKKVDGCCDTLGKSNEFYISYDYPRIAGSPFGLRVGMRYSDTPVEDKTIKGITSTYSRDYRAFNFSINRWLRKDSPSAGWAVNAGPFWREAKYNYESGQPDLYSDGVSVGLDLGITYGRIHDYLYSREGTEYGYSIQIGARALGSDETFTQNNFYYRRYHYLNGERHHNLNAQFLMGFAGGRRPLSGDFFTVGGSSTLRGYEKGAFTGESFFALNLEYLSPIRGNFDSRGVLFVDLGNAYNDNRTIDMTDLKSSAGFGLRYKVKSFMNVDLRFDAAYAFDIKDVAVYFSSRGMF